MPATTAEQIAALGAGQRQALETWIRASSTVTGWVDGYGLGRSYVDARQGRDRGAVQRKAYVRLDHATAKAVPELAGHPWREVSQALATFHRDAERVSPGTPVTREELLGLWLSKDGPDLARHGNAYMLTEERDGVRLYTGPGTTQERPYPGGPWTPVEGVVALYLNDRDQPVQDFTGRPGGQPTLFTFEGFAGRVAPLREPEPEAGPRP